MNGYMKRTAQDKTMTKAKERKKCNHSKKYFSKALGKIVCQFCGTPFGPDLKPITAYEKDNNESKARGGRVSPKATKNR